MGGNKKTMGARSELARLASLWRNRAGKTLLLQAFEQRAEQDDLDPVDRACARVQVGHIGRIIEEIDRELEVAPAIAEAVAGFNPEAGRLFEARYVDGMTTEAASAALGISVSKCQKLHAAASRWLDDSGQLARILYESAA